jgi:hypothetical protein
MQLVFDKVKFVMQVVQTVGDVHDKQGDVQVAFVVHTPWLFSHESMQRLQLLLYEQYKQLYMLHVGVFTKLFEI